MKILYSTQLAYGDIWEPEFQGIFIPSEAGVTFAYRQRRHVILSLIEEASIRERVIETPNRVDLPGDWVFFDDSKLLMCSKDFLIDTVRGRPSNLPDESYSLAYDKKQQWGKHLLYDCFVFGDYTISHHGQFGFVCNKGNTQIWKISCQGYLYTDMILYKDTVLFGTAGLGGHFYAVKLSTGEVVCDINTHGTTQFVLFNSCFYLPSRDTASKVLAISADTWDVADETVLCGTLSPYSRFTVVSNLLFVTTFSYTKRLPQQALMNVVRI